MFARFREGLGSRSSPVPTRMTPRVLKLASFAISLIAAILTILVLTAGSSPNALQGLYLLKVNPHPNPSAPPSLTMSF